MGYETSDDSAVYRLTDEMALVSTADIITPPVDDPRVFGQIAAANSLSDIYAMGGRPLTCLNLAGFPQGKLDESVLHEIVAGALDKITEAGAVLAGGHTTDDDEPKFGLAVTGIVHPDRYWSNAGARPGDAVLLTKPLGSGVLFNANLKGLVSEDAMAACVDSLVTLSKGAAEALTGFSPNAVTDVTGFGLAGHALEVARASDVVLRIDVDSLPVLDEALEMYRRGVTTGVNAANRSLIESSTRMLHGLPDWHQEILVDPQTSGGLLITLPAERADEALDALRAVGNPAARIGSVDERTDDHYLIFESSDRTSA